MAVAVRMRWGEETARPASEERADRACLYCEEDNRPFLTPTFWNVQMGRR